MESTPAAFVRLLSRGPFARYMAGESISMVGTWMQIFAQNWVLTNITLQATKLGWLVFAGGIPTLLLAMVGGSLADRYDKRRIILCSLAIQIVLACLVGGLVQTHQIAIWHLYVVAAILGTVNAFEMPTVSAFIPELVDKSDLARALSFDRALFHFTRMIGPALGGILIAAFGEPIAYYLNAMSFVALIIAVMTIAPRPRGSDEEEKERQGPMRAGFDFVRHDSPTRAMVLLMASAALFASPFFMVTMPVYARGVLGLDAGHMGGLMAFSGVGSLTGAVSLLAVHAGQRATFLKCAVSAGVAGLIGLSLAQSFPVAVCSLLLMTFGLSSAFGTAHIVIQERSPNAIRGRVSAVASLAFFGIMPFAGLAVSWFADHIGLRQSMFFGAIGYALAGAALLFGRHRLAGAPAEEKAETGTE